MMTEGVWVGAPGGAAAEVHVLRTASLADLRAPLGVAPWSLLAAGGGRAPVWHELGSHQEHVFHAAGAPHPGERALPPAIHTGLARSCGLGTALAGHTGQGCCAHSARAQGVMLCAHVGQWRSCHLRRALCESHRRARRAPLQVNIKDKWRNLQRGLQTNWRDERSHLSEDTKEKIRQLNDALTQVRSRRPRSIRTPRMRAEVWAWCMSVHFACPQQTFSGLPAGLPLLPMGGGDPLSNMTQLAAFAQVQTAHLAAAQAAAQAAAAVAGAPAAEGPTADDLAVAAAAAAAAATVAAQGDADAATE